MGTERLERHRLLHVRAAQLAHPHVDRDLAALEAARGPWRRSVSPSPSARGRRSCRCPSPRPDRRACAGGGSPERASGSAGRDLGGPGRRLGDRLFGLRGRCSSRGRHHYSTSTRWRTLVEHAADLRRVGDLDRMTDAAQAERAQRRQLALVAAVARLALGDTSASTHDSLIQRPPGLVGRLPSSVAPRACSAVSPSTWLTDRPRSSATSVGRAQRLEPGHRRLDEVDRVLGPEALARGCRGCRRARARRARRRRR